MNTSKMNAKPSLLFPITLVFYEIVNYLANDMYLPALPSLEQDFGISQDLAQYTLLSWFLGSTSMQLVMGPLSDRYGRRLILLSGGLLYIISSLVCTLTHHIEILLFARFIQGTCVCSAVVAGYATVHELYDSKTAMKVIAIMGSVIVMAPAFGPILGAMILEYVHWRWIFGLLAFFGMVSVGLLFVIMPETNKEKIPLNIQNIFSDYCAITIRKSFLGFVLPFSLIFMALISWIVETPFIIIEHEGRSPLIYGLIQLFVFGAFALGAQITGYLVYKMDPMRVIHFGLSISLLGATLFLIGAYCNIQLYWLVCLMMILGIGAGLCGSPLNRFAIEACHEPMGRRIAVFSTIMSLFGVLGTFLVARLAIETMKALSLVMGGGVILACFIFVMIHTRRSRFA